MSNPIIFSKNQDVYTEFVAITPKSIPCKKQAPVGCRLKCAEFESQPLPGLPYFLILQVVGYIFFEPSIVTRFAGVKPISRKNDSAKWKFLQALTSYVIIYQNFYIHAEMGTVAIDRNGKKTSE